MTDIRKKHRHSKQVGAPGNHRPMPPNSKILLKKWKNIHKKRGTRRKPSEEKQTENIKCGNRLQQTKETCS